MPVVIGAKPESDFTDPIGMLGDCHRRIERFSSVLLRMAAGAGGGEMSGEQRASFDNALRYFREAAPKHTADEEESLFPRLRALNDIRLLPLLATIESLEEEHVCAGRLHDEIDQLGRRWLDAGSLPPLDAERLTTALTQLDAIYRRHIRTEDSVVFPAGAAVLSAEELLLIGEEMRKRRRE
jgi:hemerythrin-like domain-containing protein